MKRGLNKKFEKEGCSETKIYKWISGPSNWFTKELHKMNKEKETIIDIDWQIYCENNQGVPIVSSYLISIWRPKLERQDDDQRVYYNQLNKLKRPAFESIGRVLIMNVSTVLLLNSDIHMSWICSWTVHNLWCNNIESPILAVKSLVWILVTETVNDRSVETRIMNWRSLDKHFTRIMVIFIPTTF